MNSTLTLVAGALALSLLTVAVRRWWTTTLRAPCAWAVGAVAGIVLVSILEPVTPVPTPKWLQVLDYTAAALTLCPTMAILGAKRPQHAAWQWIVLTLLAVLVLQAVQWWLLPGGSRFSLFTAWKILIVTIIGLGIFNYLPTGNAIASCLAASGQVVAVWPWLTTTPAWDYRVPASLCCFVAAILLARWSTRPATTRIPSLADPPIEIQWLQFRDAWGAFWALRVMQRVNQVADAEASPVRLTWHGFAGSDPAATAPPAVVRTLVALLSRFT